MMTDRITSAIALAAGIAFALAGNGRAEDEYEVGGPLAGLKLPPSKTQHGEKPGYPGCVPELAAAAKAKNPESTDFTAQGQSPELEMYPGSIEHFRAYMFKYLPVRNPFDRQSLLKNWVAPEIPGAEKTHATEYAEPVYWVPRHSEVLDTGKRNKPVAVVRCKANDPVFKLPLGELDIGLYAVRIVAAVETKDIVRHRKPIYVKMTVNDGPKGETSIYRQRIGYVDEFYSVAEIYFHSTAKRSYQAELCLDQGTAADLLVHNIDLHDALAGTIRKPIKARSVAGPPPAAASQPPIPEKDQARWARDETLWTSVPPINAQLGHIFGMGGDDPKANWARFGAGGKTPEEIKQEFGDWTSPGATGPVLLVNKKLNLQYALDDLRARKPLPDPYPFKDDGGGVYTPPETPEANPQNWYPVANGVKDRIWACAKAMGTNLLAYRTKGDLQAGRDAAILLCRLAYDGPAEDSAKAMSSILVQPGAYGRDLRCRRREPGAGSGMARGSVDSLRQYDELFDLIRGNEDLAQSVGRFVPWVKTSQDVIRLLDVYLVQDVVKRAMRYQVVDANNPAWLSAVAAYMGDGPLSASCMEWVFGGAWMYPLSVGGMTELIVTGMDRTGVKCIASFSYGQGEEASNNGEKMEFYLKAGGDPKFDIRDPKRCPKVVNACYWPLRARMAGLYTPRIGDVAGPDKPYGYTFDAMEAACRRGWRWTKDTQFAFVLKHFFGRKGEPDADWAAIEKAAEGRRAPWLENRSRFVANWFGALETGVEHDDFRFRRAAMLRIGQGWGHHHNDTLDLQIYAHGYPATIDGGQRPGYSEPVDVATRVHNVVEVDGREWIGHAWLTALSDASGARYMAAEMEGERTEALNRVMKSWASDAYVKPASAGGAGPLGQVKLYRRQVALIDVDEGQGSKPLAPEQLRFGAKLDPNVKTPNSYVFDVVRVSGGRMHTYCFHGPVDDEFKVNWEQPRGFGELPETDRKYLEVFPAKDRCSAGNAPEVVEASWRLSREKTCGNEQNMANAIWNEASPRKHTRLHLFGQQGARVLSGALHCNYLKYDFTNLYVQRRSDSDADAVFPAIVEPTVGEPFLAEKKLLDVKDNEADARRAVALELKTKDGRTDICFADGRPEKTRETASLKVAAEFALCSKDASGLRQAAITGGTLLAAPDFLLRPAVRERTGKVTAADYIEKKLTIDAVWPAGPSKGRVFEIGVPHHMTTYAIAEVRPGNGTSEIALSEGADFYMSRVRGVDAEKGLVECTLGMPYLEGNPCPGIDKGWIASNEAMTKFWRADYLGGSREENRYAFKLSPISGAGPVSVSADDFGKNGALRLWEYGAGDSVRQSTFASLRRVEPGVYALEADVEVAVGLKAAAVEMSSDGKTWSAAPGAAEGELTVVKVGPDRLSAGAVYLRAGK